MIRSANPYFHFQGNTEEAFTFYRSVFGGDFSGVLRFRDFPDNPMRIPEHALDKIAHISLPLGDGHVLQGTDVVGWMPHLNVGNNVYVTLEVESGAEADSLFEALSDGGDVEMPLQPTEWAEKYGICADRFGVQWSDVHRQRRVQASRQRRLSSGGSGRGRRDQALLTQAGGRSQTDRSDSPTPRTDQYASTRGQSILQRGSYFVAARRLSISSMAS